jgi:hypothetical protein
MFSTVRLRFHHWAVGALLAFVLTLTALFLYVVIGRFNDTVEADAKERFALIAQTAAERIQRLIGRTSSVVAAEARTRAERYVKDGRLSEQMVPTFFTQLDSERNLYSVYFGLENDEFLQVVSTREDPKVIATLGAPAGTRFAVRRILGKASGGREESWEFWSADPARARRAQRIDRLLSDAAPVVCRCEEDFLRFRSRNRTSLRRPRRSGSPCPVRCETASEWVGARLEPRGARQFRVQNQDDTGRRYRSTGPRRPRARLA